MSAAEPRHGKSLEKRYHHFGSSLISWQWKLVMELCLRYLTVAAIFRGRMSMKEVDEQVSFKAFKLFCKWCLFSYNPNFSSDACSAKQEFRQFRRMDPKQCQGIFVLWKQSGFCCFEI